MITGLFWLDRILIALEIPVEYRPYLDMMLLGVLLTPMLLPFGFAIAAVAVIVSQRAREDWRVWTLIILAIVAWQVMGHAVHRMF